MSLNTAELPTPQNCAPYFFDTFTISASMEKPAPDRLFRSPKHYRYGNKEQGKLKA